MKCNNIQCHKVKIGGAGVNVTYAMPKGEEMSDGKVPNGRYTT